MSIEPKQSDPRPIAVGKVIEVGEDKKGNCRVLISVSREAAQRLGGLLYSKVEIRPKAEAEIEVESDPSPDSPSSPASRCSRALGDDFGQGEGDLSDAEGDQR
jgi:hypothetical protein